MRTPRHAPVDRSPARCGAAPHGATTKTRPGPPVPKTFRNEERPS